MSEATIRSALKVIVKSVTDVGIVHDYERWANEWEDFLNLFKKGTASGDVIRGWTIGYGGFIPGDPQEFGNVFVRSQKFMIRGYQQLDDSEESEKDAAALAEDVCDMLDAAVTIRPPNYYYATNCTLLFEPRMFGGILCHYAEISLNVLEVI